jgi:hypothetical protein
VISVDAGTFTFYSATDCVAQNFAAGQGVVEAGGGVQLARNEGTEPLVLHVVYFDVPVGGDFRIDEPEPANCTGLAPVPTATPVPTAVPTAAPAASALPDAALRVEPGQISPSPLPTLVAVACIGALIALGLFRSRRRN